MCNLLKDEKCLSHYSSRFQICSLNEQIKILDWLLYSDYSTDDVYLPKETLLPKGAEGWFVIPHWRSLAYDYEGATKRILQLIEKRFSDVSISNIRLSHGNVKQSQSKIHSLSHLRDYQVLSKYFIIPAQLGIRYDRVSALDAALRMKRNEFALGIFEVLCILLTHPNRLVFEDQLGIKCSGDECRYRASDSKFNYNFSVGIRNNKIWTGLIKKDMINSNFGIMSSFSL